MTIKGNKNALGYRHSKETIEKLSIRMKGNNNPNFGKPGTMLGKNHTDETKKKMSLATSGSNNSQWRGGIAVEPYCDIWLDEEYKESIRERDNNICQNPDCHNSCDHLTLDIHHIDYDKKNCHPQNLITLCRSCNVRANYNRKYWTKFYQGIMRGQDD